MSAIIYDSRPLVAQLTEELQREATQFRSLHHRSARLTQIIVGHDAAAEVYSRQLVRACRTIGLGCATLVYPFEMDEEELRTEVATLNDDAGTDGVVLLLPLPIDIRQRIVTDVLRPEKDVDGLGASNAGNLLLGFPSFIPSTADGMLAVLRDEDIPIALITADMVKPGAVVLDAGINSVNGKVVGDVDFPAVKEVASFLTPVPGGLGPLTHLTLIRHTLLGPQ